MYCVCCVRCVCVCVLCAVLCAVCCVVCAACRVLCTVCGVWCVLCVLWCRVAAESAAGVWTPPVYDCIVVNIDRQELKGVWTSCDNTRHGTRLVRGWGMGKCWEKKKNIW